MTRSLRDLRIGDPVPTEWLDGPQEPLGAPLTGKPVWHALMVPPQKEAATRASLRVSGAFAFYPEREKSWQVRGKWFSRKYPITPGIVYARFRAEPRWHIMRERRLITGVFTSGGWPIVIPVPIVRRVQGLEVSLAEWEQAKREMAEIRAGDTAVVVDGPFDGLAVSITRTEAGRAWFETLTGLKGEVPVERLQKRE